MTEVKQPTLDEVKVTVAEDYSLDAETQGELIDSIADKQFSLSSDNQKELSKAIDKKAEYRDKLVEAGLIDPKTFKPIDKSAKTITEKKPDGEQGEIKLNTGDKAYLNSLLSIKGKDELALSENWLNKYKCDIDEMVEDEVFTAKLNKLREAKAVKDAIPSSNKRSTGSDNKAVDYWIDKPFNEVPKELQKDVLNAQIKRGD